MAREYDEETSDFWERFPVSIFKKFRESVSGKILDLGSGPGREGLILKKSGLEVVCLDASEEMVKITRQKGLESIQADLMKIPIEDQFFDGVWAYTSLLHIPRNDLPKALKEISRVLKEGGIFGLGMIEGDNQEYRESSGVNLPRLFTFYTKERLEKSLQKAGFEIIYYEEFQPKSKKYLNFISKKI